MFSRVLRLVGCLSGFILVISVGLLFYINAVNPFYYNFRANIVLPTSKHILERDLNLDYMRGFIEESNEGYLVIFDPTCVHCRATLQELNRLSDLGVVDFNKFIFLAVGIGVDKSEDEKFDYVYEFFTENKLLKEQDILRSNLFFITLEGFKQAAGNKIKTVPYIFKVNLKDGSIIKVLEGVVPNNLRDELGL